MALEIEFAGRRPVVDPGAFVAPTAVLVGDVTVAAGASVWCKVVLRADFGPIVVGAGSNVQDNCVLHAAEGLPTRPRGRGDRRPPGHDGGLGNRARRPDRDGCGGPAARPGRHGVGCRGRECGRRGRADSPDVLAAGIPVQSKRELSGKAEQWGRTAAREYQRLAPRYLAEARAVRLISGGSG